MLETLHNLNNYIVKKITFSIEEAKRNNEQLKSKKEFLEDLLKEYKIMPPENRFPAFLDLFVTSHLIEFLIDICLKKK